MPDVSFAGYLVNTRIGAIAYNTMHVTLGPLILGPLGFLLPSFDLIAVALIWAAHIGVDRALGYGLKYGAGFGLTHLGRIGGALTGSQLLILWSAPKARLAGRPHPLSLPPSFETGAPRPPPEGGRP